MANYGYKTLIWLILQIVVVYSQTPPINTTVPVNATADPVSAISSTTNTVVPDRSTTNSTPEVSTTVPVNTTADPVSRISSTTNTIVPDRSTTNSTPEISTTVPTTNDSTPLINTTSGFVSGYAEAFLDSIVDQFLGIPYAEPPLGDLRFAKPQPRKPWTDTFDAVEYGAPCPQYSSEGFNRNSTEDCLSLNVFVPRGNDSVPVMVWIHGGSFQVGGSSLYPGVLLAAVGNVMVVTINYRLGVFGFLSTGDDCATGNWGLWDQRLALKWVKENAERFGGNPDQITVFGESAGANSILYQALYPMNTQSLFKRIIVQSAPHDHFSTNGRDVTASLVDVLGQNLGCKRTDGGFSSVVQCLRNVSQEDLLTESLTLPTNFVPAIDEELIRETYDFSSLSQYDLLIGVNSGDASVFYGGETGIGKGEFLFLVDFFAETFCRGYDKCEGKALAIQAAIFAYNDLQSLDDPYVNLVRILNMAYDVAFSTYMANIARLRSEISNTFAYEFAYEDTEFYRPEIPRTIIQSPVHAEDTFYVFGLPVLNGTMQQGQVSLTFMTYWANFAHNGDPNVGNTDYIDVTWPKFDLENQSYLILKPNATVGQNFAAEAYDFWYGYIKDLIDEAADEESCLVDAGVPVWDSLSPPEPVTYTIPDLGSINGTMVYVPDAVGPSKVHTIHGIPYAKPPVGSLRFAPTEETEGWDDILDGTMPAPPCPDGISSGSSEDCLTLDIAAVHSEQSLNPLPVIVFINGHNFQSGGQTPSAEVLAAGTRSVVVTFRYRVGALGFLSTEDEYAKGNFGLLDIVAVLEWVNKYIDTFDVFKGDPNNVILMGYGTGGSIVNLLLYSKLTAGLFHRAISLSGTATSRGLQNLMQPDPLEQAISLGNEVGCRGNTKQLIDCLRNDENVTVSDILAASESFSPFFPVVDDNVLTDNIQDLTQDKSYSPDYYSPVDYLIGITEYQAAVKLMGMMEQTDACLSEAEFKEYVSSFLDMYISDPGPVRQVVAAEYLSNLPSPSEDQTCPRLARFLEFLNDFFVVIPTLHTAKTHTAAGGRVFLYSFEQTPRHRNNHTANLPSWVGPSYGDDLQYLFGMPYAVNSPVCYGQEDRETTLVLMRILQDFITSGDPSSIDDLQNDEWPEFDATSRSYLEVEACPSVSETAFAATRLRFWTDILPLLLTAPPIDPPGVPAECKIGEGLGIILTPSQATSLIQILIGVAIGLVVVILITCGAFCGARRQIQDNKISGYELGHEIPGGWKSRGDEESDML